MIDQTNISVVVGNYLGQLWEMPRKPFLDPHREGVQVLVQLVKDSNALDDMFVLSINIQADSVSGEGMAQTQICLQKIGFYDIR